MSLLSFSIILLGDTNYCDTGLPTVLITKMAPSHEFWIFIGSCLFLSLFVLECLNAYTVNVKHTALSLVFHTVIGLIGAAIAVSVFGVSIVVCLLIMFLCLVILIIYLTVTALEIVGLGIVVATVIGCTGYALETIALTLLGPRLEITAVKNLIRVGLIIPICTLSTCFATLLVPLLWHRESTAAPEFPLGLTFGTGMRFCFSFRATLQKKFTPDWKPRPYWDDVLEGNFGIYPFSQKHLNPILERPTANFPTGIHNQQRPKVAVKGNLLGNGTIATSDFDRIVRTSR